MALNLQSTNMKWPLIYKERAAFATLKNLSFRQG